MSKLQGTGKTRLAIALVAVVVIVAMGVYLSSVQKPSEPHQAKTNDAGATNPDTPQENPISDNSYWSKTEDLVV